MAKPANYWNNYENCYNAAKEHKTKSEFIHKHLAAYRNAKKNGWLDNYTWFVETRKSPNYWNNYENCYNEAKKYKTRSEFEKKCRGAYKKAAKNGWLDDYTWFERALNPHNDNIDNVYAYIFQNEQTIYIGRSYRLQHRNHEHNTKSKSSVYKFAKENGIPIPKMTILKSNLSLKDGLYYEDEYRKQYIKDGWNVLNVAPTGVDVGSIGAASRKWTKNRCFELAKKCLTKNEFRRKSNSAYNSALINGWDKEYTWFLSETEARSAARRYWTYERCYEEAQKYKSKIEFYKKCHGGYEAAYKYGWLNDFDWLEAIHKPNGYWTFEKSYNAAKECSTKAEFKLKFNTAYNHSRENGWLDKFDWLVEGRKPSGYWNKERCYEVAKECSSRSDMEKKFVTAYNNSKENGWIEDYTWFEEIKKPNGYWTYERCYEEAKKYKTLGEFQKKSGSAYVVSRKKGWKKDYTWFVNGRKNLKVE